MAAHRYWRICVTSNAAGGSGSAGDADVTLTDVELRTAAGGSDATGSGSASANNARFGSSAAAAFDTQPYTFWKFTADASNWLKYDFGAGNDKDIVEVALTCGLATGFAPRDFTVQWSDDASAWTTVMTVTGATEWTPGQRRTFNSSGETPTPDPPAACRYWRLVVSAVQGSGGVPEIAKLQLRESVGGADATGSGSAFSGTTIFYGNPANAFDSNASTVWSPSNGVAGENSALGYDFGSGVTKNIAEIAITTHPTDANLSPTTFILQRSSDKLGWVGTFEVSGSTGWVAGETRTFAATPSDVDAVIDTAQAQTSSATADAVTEGVTTEQAQTSLAAVGISVAAVVETSQAQTSAAVSVPDPVDAAIDTAQAQTSSAATAATNLWSIVNAAIDLQDDPDGNNSSNYSFTGNKLLPGLGATTTGNHIVVLVAGHWRTDDTPTITVTDNAGNTYLAASPVSVLGSGTPSVNVRMWSQAFYCNSATGHSNLIPQFDVTQGAGATVFDLPSRMHIAAFEVGSDLAVVPDTYTAKTTATQSTALTTDAFDTTAAGAVFAIELNFFADSIVGSTVNFESDYTDLPRPGRLPSTGGSDQTQGAAAYRVTSGPLTGEQVTFTGDASSHRALFVYAFKNVAASIETTAETSQAQTTLALGGIGWAGDASTAQAQTSDAVGDVRSVTYVGLSGVEGAGLVGDLDAEVATPLTGVEATVSTGLVGATTLRAITGVQAAGAAGAITGAPRVVATTGVTAAGAAGSVTISRAKALSGVAGSGQVATIFARLAPPLTGVQATGAVGTMTPPKGLSGHQATGRVGSVRTRVSKALTGVEATGSVGTLGTIGTTRLSGVSSTGSVGSVSSSRTRELSGVTGATTVGTVLPSQVTLGVAASGSVGSLGQTRTIALTGVTASTAVGYVGNQQTVNSDSVFVSAPTVEVSTSPVTASVLIISSAVQVLVNQQDEQVRV